MAQEPVELFLQLTWADGSKVKGESTDTDFAGFIEILHFDVNLGQPPGDHDEPDDIDVDDEEGKADLALAMDPSVDPDVGPTGHDHTLSVKKVLDVSSPELFRAYCENLPGFRERREQQEDAVQTALFESCSVYARRAGGAGAGRVYLVLTFREVNVIFYQLQTSEPLPEEQVRFSFDEFELHYREQGAKGKHDEPWSVGWVDFTKEPVFGASAPASEPPPPPTLPGKTGT